MIRLLARAWLAFRQARLPVRANPLDFRPEPPLGWDRRTALSLRHALFPEATVSWSPFMRRWVWVDAYGRLNKHLLRNSACQAAYLHWRQVI